MNISNTDNFIYLKENIAEYYFEEFGEKEYEDLDNAVKLDENAELGLMYTTKINEETGVEEEIEVLTIISERRIIYNKYYQEEFNGETCDVQKNTDEVLSIEEYEDFIENLDFQLLYENFPLF